MSEAEQEVAGEEVSAPTRSTHPFHRRRPSSPRYASSPGPNPRVRDGIRPGHASRSNSIARRDSARFFPPARSTRARTETLTRTPPASPIPRPAAHDRTRGYRRRDGRPRLRVRRRALRRGEFCFAIPFWSTRGPGVNPHLTRALGDRSPRERRRDGSRPTRGARGSRSPAANRARGHTPAPRSPRAAARPRPDPTVRPPASPVAEETLDGR